MASGEQDDLRVLGDIAARRKGSAVVGENRTQALATREELTTDYSPPSMRPVQDEQPCGHYLQEACIPRSTSFSTSSSSSYGTSSSCSCSSQRHGCCFDPTWEKIPVTSDFDQLLNQVLIRCHQQSALIPTAANLRSIAVSLGFGYVEADDFLVHSTSLPLALDKCLTSWRRSCDRQEASEMEERLSRAICQSGSERLFATYRDAYEAFKLFSSNLTEIAVSDLSSVLRCLGFEPNSEVERVVLAESNADETGSVPWGIFSSIIDGLGDEMCRGPRPTEVVEAFRQFDRDSSGLIAASEIRHLLSGLEEELEDTKIQDLIHDRLLDGDGQLNYHEFVEILSCVVATAATPSSGTESEACHDAPGPVQ